MEAAIKDYKILKTLAKGSFGEVHLAQTIDKTKFILKLIPVSKESKEDVRKQAQMHAAFDHPNIVKTREFFFFQKEYYLVIVLEYCEQGSLSNHIGKIEQKQHLKMMKQITQGLVYLHDEKKVAHRDLKPQNILLSNGNPKISNLGIAKTIKKQDSRNRNGQKNYLAPQILDKNEAAADIWSLGIVFLQLLTGKRVNEFMKGCNPPALNYDFLSENVLNQIKSTSMKDLIQKMLTKNPAHRPTAKQVLIMLLKMGKNQFSKPFVKIQKESIPIKRNKINQTQKICHISQKKFIQLISQDVQFPKLTLIEQYADQISDKGLKVLAGNAYKYPNLKTINLWSGHCSSQGVKQFSKKANLFSSLNFLSFENNKIQDKGVEALVENADKFQSLEILYLTRSNITGSGMQYLAKNAAKFSQLKRLHLDQNQITSVGLKALAESPFKFPILECLYLTQNKINDEGIKAFAVNGSKFSRLQILFFDDNQITDSGFKTLVANAEKLTNLKSLSISLNKLSNAGVKALTQNASKFKSLQKVYMGSWQDSITQDCKKQVEKLNLSFKIHINP